MAKERKQGITWAKQLSNYARLLNNEKRKEREWKIPFGIYFGR